MQNYLDTLQKIMEEGDDRMTRNGWTRALFGLQLRFDLERGFPAMTTKKLAFKAVAAELLWFLEGSTTTKRLKEIAGFDLKIWDGDAKRHFENGKAETLGELGPVYGKQWRRWRKIVEVPDHAEGTEWVPDACAAIELDQLAEVIVRLKEDPFDRRLVVMAWNPGEVSEMALPPCHMMFQFFVSSNGELSLQMYQRSCDMFLGVPFNIASYALLLSMTAQVTGYSPKECILTLGDAHIYHKHFAQVEEQLTRKPMRLPALWLNTNICDLNGFTMNDFRLIGYKHHPHIKAELLTEDVK